jgi:hypothetical protein
MVIQDASLEVHTTPAVLPVSAFSGRNHLNFGNVLFMVNFCEHLILPFKATSYAVSRVLSIFGVKKVALPVLSTVTLEEGTTTRPPNVTEGAELMLAYVNVTFVPPVDGPELGKNDVHRGPLSDMYVNGADHTMRPASCRVIFAGPACLPTGILAKNLIGLSLLCHNAYAVEAFVLPKKRSTRL